MTVCNCGGKRNTLRLVRGNTILTHEVTLAEQRDGSLFAPLGYDAETCPACLNIENGVARTSLRKDHCVFWALQDGSAQPGLGEESFGIKSFGIKSFGIKSFGIKCPCFARRHKDLTGRTPQNSNCIPDEER